MRKKSLIVLVNVALAYFVSNLTFDYGLDDTALQIEAEGSIGNASFRELLAAMPRSILNPPPADSLGLYRPLRPAYSWVLLFASGKFRWLPDLISAIVAGICAVVLLRYYTLCKLSPRNALIAALWFFTCIPVVAMGQVVFVCQFVVISGLYLVLMLFQRYLDCHKPMWLFLAFLAVFVFGLYGEAMLIAPLAVGVYGVNLLLKRNFGNAARALAFAGVGGFLVLGNAFLMTGDPGQFIRGIRSVLVTRGYNVSEMGHSTYFAIMLNRLRGYSQSFRPVAFTGIFFSISPLLFLTGMLSFAWMAVVKRRFVILAALAASGAVAYWNAAWGIGAASTVLCLAYAASHPLLVSMFVAGALVLGPIFIIDTHITYLLPALIGLLFVALSEACCWLQAHRQRVLIWCPAAALALVAGANFVTGVYFSARVANDNRELAAHVGEAIRSGSVLVNFRHAVDLYFYANQGRKLSDYGGDLHFTATVPVWDESRAVRDEKKLREWFDAAEAAGKPNYFLVVDHDRLANKVDFHGPRFLDNPLYQYDLRYLHVFDATGLFFDPGFLLVNYFYNKALSAGFIGYPIFPDMIDDVGVGYGLFTKRLFACYRLLEVKRRVEAQTPSASPGHASEEKVVLPDYHGYEVVAPRQHLLARSRTAGAKDSPDHIVSERLDILLQKIRARSASPRQRIGEFGAPQVRLIEEGVKGFNILACNDRIIGLGQDEGAFDVNKLSRHEYGRCVEGDSVEDVKRLILSGVTRHYP
jgi:hypothetical protein